jgi:uncharacterized delta-60 repeat protein
MAKFKNRLCKRFNELLAGLLLAVAPPQSYAASGDLDLSFDPGSTVNGTVEAVVVQPDGKVLIGGDFTTVHGAMRSWVARLNSDGSTDPAFLLGLALVGNAYSTPVVNCLALQDDGKILIGGSFISTNGAGRTNIARLNPDGSVDDSFVAQVAGPGVYALWGGSVDSIIVQSDGKILLSGGFISVSEASRSSIARLNPDGTLDTAFNPILGVGFDQPWVSAAALQSDGKILIAGNFNLVNGLPRDHFARLNADGSLDSEFLNGLADAGGDTIRSIACQTDGKVLIGGTFSSFNGAPHNGIARLNADGSTDTSFLADVGWVYSLAVQPDGKVLIGGQFSQVNGSTQDGIARLNPDGSLDSSLPNGVAGSDGYINSIALQNDGTIIFGGSFQSAARNNLARLNPDGSLDSTFCNGPIGPNKRIDSLAIQPDQKILVGGAFTAVSGEDRSRIARLNADGTLDNSFLQGLEGANDRIMCMTLQGDGRILVGGYFTSVNGVTRNRVARLNADGSLDDSFLEGLAGANDRIICMALQGDGRVLIGGYFTSVNGVTRNRVARLNADGSLDDSFLQGLEGADSRILSTALQSDGRILIGGSFTSVNGMTRNRVARLNADGSLDSGFLNELAGANEVVGGLAVQRDGRILIGGGFTSVNGVAATNVARLLANGALDGSFRCSGLPALVVTSRSFASFGIQRDGKVVILEVRDPFPPLPNNLFRLNADGSLDNSFLGDQPGPNKGVTCLGFQADGKLLIGGLFTAVNQTPRSFVARLMGEYGPPAIQIPPQSATAEAGSEIRLPLRATGYPPLSYQWFFDDTNALSGCTNRYLNLTNVQLSDCGAYTVVISNAAGAITSAPAMLSVIPPVDRRPVPALKVLGQAGSSLHVEYTDALGSLANWLPLGTVNLTGTSQFFFDISLPLPPQRFYRAWETGTPAVLPSLNLPYLVPAITLTGNIEDSLRVDCINAIGPTNAWVMLDTVKLTNTSQLCFDVSAPGQAQRLYRIVPVP